MVSSGIFYPLESIVINVVYYLMILINYLIIERSMNSIYDLYELGMFFAFNVLEILANYKFETSSFCSILAANKTSIQYIEFVSRLLPKHVVY